MRWLGLPPKWRLGGVGKQLSRRTRLFISAAAVLVVVAGAAAGDAIVRGLGEFSATNPAAVAPGPAGAGASSQAGAPASFADVVARVKPAVVSVQVRVVGAADEEDALDAGRDGPFDFRRFGDPSDGDTAGELPEGPQFLEGPRSDGQAQGSGFFISPDGYIVTNNHVVADARSVTVTLDNGRTLDARVVATDPRTDLAVIKTESGSKHPHVRFAGAAPRIGDWVVAVGNPFGFGGTVTAGIVSAHGRDIGAGPYDDFLQVDAPVNQGNSGGPVFNMKGEVVGINTAIASPTGGNVGIAFAIPAATAVPIVRTLRAGGQVVRGYLGVALQALDDEIARSVGLRGRDGALVAEVSAEGPAARAGVRPGDVILSVGGRRVADSRDLARVVAEHRPGARLDFEFVRDGRRMRTAATLATTPEDETGRGKSRTGSGDNGSAALGMHVTPAAGGGVRVLSVRDDSEAASRGLAPGDVILEAGGRPCASAADLRRAADAARRNGRGAVLLRVQTGNLPRYVGLPLSSDQG